MPQPELTPQEKTLIARLDDPRLSALAYELAYLVPSALLVLVGFAYRAPAAFACAFAVIFTFRLYELYHRNDQLSLLRSVLHKYRQACGE